MKKTLNIAEKNIFYNWLTFIKNYLLIMNYIYIGDWGLGIGDWGLGIAPSFSCVGDSVISGFTNMAGCDRSI